MGTPADMLSCPVSYLNRSDASRIILPASSQYLPRTTFLQSGMRRKVSVWNSIHLWKVWFPRRLIKTFASWWNIIWYKICGKYFPWSIHKRLPCVLLYAAITAAYTALAHFLGLLDYLIKTLCAQGTQMKHSLVNRQTVARIYYFILTMVL